MGTLEAFVHEEPIDVSQSGPATLQVLGDDPLGASVGTDLVEVPVIPLQGVAGYVPHQVVDGDSLTRLAAQYGSKVDHIALANGL